MGYHTIASLSLNAAPTKRVFHLKCGLLTIGPRLPRAFRQLGEYSVLVALYAIALHPAVASLAPRKLSILYVALCLLVLLPLFTRIVLVPFLSIMLASAMIMVSSKSPSPIVFGLVAYAMFFMVVYRTRLFYTAYLGVSLTAAAVALLQFLFPFEFLNFHATAESINSFLDQYRPTSIFPSQAYYNQLLLGLLPLFYLAKERRPWVYLVVGGAAAMTGSTAGLVLALLAIFLATGRGYLVLVGFVAVIAIQAIGFRERLIYNFAPEDILLSVGSRIVLPTDVASPGAILGAAAGHPTLLIGVETIALFGILGMTMLACRSRLAPSVVVSYGAALSAIVVGQMIHHIAGSLYFSLSLALLGAVAWNFVTDAERQIQANGARRSAVHARAALSRLRKGDDRSIAD